MRKSRDEKPRSTEGGHELSQQHKVLGGGDQEDRKRGEITGLKPKEEKGRGFRLPSITAHLLDPRLKEGKSRKNAGSLLQEQSTRKNGQEGNQKGKDMVKEKNNPEKVTQRKPKGANKPDLPHHR